MSILNTSSRHHKAVEILFLLLLSRESLAFLAKSTNVARPSVMIGTLFSSFGEDDQAVEALRSLVDFHEGRWTGVARSFTVVPDTAAGIVQRKVSPSYEVFVKLGLINDNDYSITETFSWGDKMSSRSLFLEGCSVDVDSVDASYSLDATLPDFPAEISGSGQLCQFLVEHCIAASEDTRHRCFVLYGVDKNLQRVVLCDEKRVKDKSPPGPSAMEGPSSNSNQLTARDLLEMQDDVDRLVEKLTGGMGTSDPKPTESTSSPSMMDQLGGSMASDDGAQKLLPHQMSLLEVSSGVWLGDAVIRDNEVISRGSKGFGNTSPAAAVTKRFAEWNVGVQKVAWRWMWNFGDEIRQVLDVGKAMGSQLADCMAKSTAGSVCINESLSRRMAKEERMVYIDWTGDRVGFLSGPTCIQVPRYLSFDDSSASSKPFYTDFLLFQATEVESDAAIVDVEEETASLPDLCCSKISRVYNSGGQLMQGSTSFYTFNRFGIDENM